MTNPAMRSYYVDRLVAEIAAPLPIIVLSRPPPF
jgi:hypothetical protein